MNEDILVVNVVFRWILIIILASFFFSFISRMWRKTREYREDLTNLYVAGKVKQIAGKDGIDLEKELKDFRRFDKLMNSSYKQLDEVIENEMKEQIQKDFEEVKTKVEKKK